MAIAIPVRPPALWRRLALFALTLGTGGSLTYIWWDLLTGNGISGFDIAQTILFCLTVTLLSLFFWTAVFGFFRLMLGGRTPGLFLPDSNEPLATDRKIAILIPVYNEETAAVFGNLVAMYQSLERLGQLGPFHFFVLSDTTDPDVWVQEEAAWYHAQHMVGGQGRIFYRHRHKNTARKAGNIADFCERWGAQYEHMIMLDADSLLTASTIVQLSKVARLNPKAGIIQGLPSVIGARSFYARSQQFAVRLYGPMLGAGLNAWHLGDGNYWGHNAIINTAFFTQHCGLPHLSGKPPFGGHILSHDFIEAALMRRAGWQVWLLTEVEGCYEQVPPTLLDNAKRERRWVQGNLQHIRLLFAAGLHPLSRLHLLTGIAAFKASLLCLLFLLVGMAAAMHMEFVPPDYFGDTVSLFPTWPLFDGEQAMVLLGIVFSMLILPKILAGLTMMGRASAGFGGRGRIWLSILLEHIYTALIAPVLMLVHSTFIIDVLLGRDSGWGKQNRGDAETSWAEAWQRHRWHVLFGLLVAAIGYGYAPSLVWWLSPVVIGLILSPFMSVWSSRVSVGQWLARRRLLATPEELSPPREWTEARTAEATLLAQLPASTGPLGMLEFVLNDPMLNALHMALLPENSETLANPDDLARAQGKLAAAVTNLSSGEKTALLYHSPTLIRLGHTA